VSLMTVSNEQKREGDNVKKDRSDTPRWLNPERKKGDLAMASTKSTHLGDTVCLLPTDLWQIDTNCFEPERRGHFVPEPLPYSTDNIVSKKVA